MKITLGKFKGRNINCPKGARPSKSILREGLFNILTHRFQVFENKNLIVLDAFAGSGIIGFEFLSRGASLVNFCDNNKACIDMIKKTTESFECTDECNLYCVDFYELTGGIVGDIVDVAFLDPPYSSIDFPLILSKLECNRLISEKTLIVIESDRLSEKIDNFETIFSKKYGKSYLNFWKINKP